MPRFYLWIFVLITAVLACGDGSHPKGGTSPKSARASEGVNYTSRVQPDDVQEPDETEPPDDPEPQDEPEPEPDPQPDDPEPEPEPEPTAEERVAELVTAFEADVAAGSRGSLPGYTSQIYRIGVDQACHEAFAQLERLIMQMEGPVITQMLTGIRDEVVVKETPLHEGLAKAIAIVIIRDGEHGDAASEILATLDDKAMVGAYGQALTDPAISSRERIAAMGIVVSERFPIHARLEAVPFLIACESEVDPQVRGRALTALEEITSLPRNTPWAQWWSEYAGLGDLARMNRLARDHAAEIRRVRVAIEDEKIRVIPTDPLPKLLEYIGPESTESQRLRLAVFDEVERRMHSFRNDASENADPVYPVMSRILETTSELEIRRRVYAVLSAGPPRYSARASQIIRERFSLETSNEMRLLAVSTLKNLLDPASGPFLVGLILEDIPDDGWRLKNVATDFLNTVLDALQHPIGTADQVDPLSFFITPRTEDEAGFLPPPDRTAWNVVKNALDPLYSIADKNRQGDFAAALRTKILYLLDLMVTIPRDDRVPISKPIMILQIVGSIEDVDAIVGAVRHENVTVEEARSAKNYAFPAVLGLIQRSDDRFHELGFDFMMSCASESDAFDGHIRRSFIDLCQGRPRNTLYLARAIINRVPRLINVASSICSALRQEIETGSVEVPANQLARLTACEARLSLRDANGSSKTYADMVALRPVPLEGDDLRIDFAYASNLEGTAKLVEIIEAFDAAITADPGRSEELRGIMEPALAVVLEDMKAQGRFDQLFHKIQAIEGQLELTGLPAEFKDRSGLVREAFTSLCATDDFDRTRRLVTGAFANRFSPTIVEALRGRIEHLASAETPDVAQLTQVWSCLKTHLDSRYPDHSVQFDPAAPDLAALGEALRALGG